MSESYLVIHSAVLGPPHTERTYRAGELVLEEDFAACPDQLARLEKFAAIRPVLPHEREKASAERERNLRDHLGLPSNASMKDAEEIARLRREGQRQTLEEMQRRQAFLHGSQTAMLTASGAFVSSTQAAAAAEATDPSDTSDSSEPTANQPGERRGRRKAEE